MTNQASLFNIIKGRNNFMVGKFLSSLTGKWHMTISTCQPPFRMYSGHEKLIIRMLGLDHWRFTNAMSPVFKVSFIIILLNLFNLSAIFPGEDKIISWSFKIIFGMALRAYQSAHILM